MPGGTCATRVAPADTATTLRELQRAYSGPPRIMSRPRILLAGGACGIDGATVYLTHTVVQTTAKVWLWRCKHTEQSSFEREHSVVLVAQTKSAYSCTDNCKSQDRLSIETVARPLSLSELVSSSVYYSIPYVLLSYVMLYYSIVRYSTV